MTSFAQTAQVIAHDEPMQRRGIEHGRDVDALEALQQCQDRFGREREAERRAKR